MAYSPRKRATWSATSWGAVRIAMWPSPSSTATRLSVSRDWTSRSLSSPTRGSRFQAEGAPGSSATRAPPGGVVALLRPQLPRNRVRSCDTSWPDRRRPKLLQGIRVEAGFCQEDAEELLALIFGKKRIEPSQELRSFLGNARGGLVEHEAAEVAGERSGAECHARAVRVAEDVRRLREGVHESGDVRKLLFDGIAVRRISALSAATAVDRIEREPVAQQRLDEPKGEVLHARPVDENEQRAGPDRSYAIAFRRSTLRAPRRTTSVVRRHPTTKLGRAAARRRRPSQPRAWLLELPDRRDPRLERCRVAAREECLDQPSLASGVL